MANIIYVMRMFRKVLVKEKANVRMNIIRLKIQIFKKNLNNYVLNLKTKEKKSKIYQDMLNVILPVPLNPRTPL